MKKFERMNKLTNTKEWYIGVTGVLKTIEDEPRQNKVSGKDYFRFTAEVDTPKGSTLIGGQVYDKLIPYLGGKPSVGDRLEFASKLTDLQEEKVNTRWNIGGHAVDDVDNFLDALDDL